MTNPTSTDPIHHLDKIKTTPYTKIPTYKEHEGNEPKAAICQVVTHSCVHWLCRKRHIRRNGPEEQDEDEPWGVALCRTRVVQLCNLSQKIVFRRPYFFRAGKRGWVSFVPRLLLRSLFLSRMAKAKKKRLFRDGRKGVIALLVVGTATFLFRPKETALSLWKCAVVNGFFAFQCQI